VLAEIIAELAIDPIPRRELAPVAELLSMGMASLVLWWIEDTEVSRTAVLDALTTVWVRVLGVDVD
jgi:hypothetical protein